MLTISKPAPEWRVDSWLNTSQPLSLQSLRGRVIVLLSFQMLCPGCVAQALPLAARVHATFPHDQVAMIGLHTVFEHHEAMTPVALRAFAHEYWLQFPIGVDRHEGTQPLPLTMQAYGMRGTPTWTLIDRDGRLRQQHFGEFDPLRLGAEIAALMLEPGAAATRDTVGTGAVSCSDGTCAIPSSPNPDGAHAHA